MSKVAVIMGSISDMPVMQEAIEILKGFDIEIEVDIVSAHRTPEKLFDFSKKRTHTWNFGNVLVLEEQLILVW
jgi:phosphoribosylcarboxyaminoimidazole (NCAIR) mutase